MGARMELAGLRFDRLRVVSESGRNAAGQVTWLCRCDCGGSTVAAGSRLVHGGTRSCGCLAQDLATTHGYAKHPLYAVWRQMLGRCENPKHKQYGDYGARGITVCDAWHEVSQFIADMGDRPSPLHSLERVDNNLGYSPENCRWATRAEQNRNRRVTRYFDHLGERLTLQEWAERLGISKATLASRLYLYGWIVEKAFTTPTRHNPIKELI